MAKQTRTVTDYTDDMTGLPLTGDEVEEDFTLIIDGVKFVMDTTVVTANSIREMLMAVVGNAEIKGGDYVSYQAAVPAPAPVERAPKHSAKRQALVQKIRSWAKANDFDIADQGRIPQPIQRAFEIHNPDVDMSPLKG
ncbi:histone-like nucleoid-structuring protein Lsr2 [Streptomyces sp. NPDC057654]|uniref:Lsr2 family DNA-binding protein n=1 Tax=Streptomyces sp. NPDC057654 TaxID=3346196 RepID=UPI0036C072D8